MSKPSKAEVMEAIATMPHDMDEARAWLEDLREQIKVLRHERDRAREFGRAEGREDAARVADAERQRAEEQKARNIADYPNDLHNSANQHCDGTAYTAKTIAAGIRALSPLRPVAEVCPSCVNAVEFTLCKHGDSAFSCGRDEGCEEKHACETCAPFGARGAVVRWEESKP